MIFVDEPQAINTVFAWTYWSHVASNGSINELHEFAKHAGIAKCWFINNEKLPHYRVRLSDRYVAVEAGAMQITKAQLVERCRRS